MISCSDRKMQTYTTSSKYLKQYGMNEDMDYIQSDICTLMSSMKNYNKNIFESTTQEVIIKQINKENNQQIKIKCCRQLRISNSISRKMTLQMVNVVQQ